MAARLGAGSSQARLAAAIATAGSELAGDHPTIDLGLVALRRVLGLPEGAAFAMFAAGRSVGFVAHALEQYRDGRLIRPRARYVGP
ncbi:MAG: hypothetical protein FJZ00_02385 [Candidatus Sericytochromatia bacterium]|uniref:citrate synthase (unknown stereospecificity) n=1 Tax=Candidatus Tanganyikabacteria bacterium TaxID=2961651 RepID=A0A937X4C2_9BACT|nr:hypothetical protein [Candidatus Tanganyikabacteria bacterium]